MEKSNEPWPTFPRMFCHQSTRYIVGQLDKYENFELSDHHPNTSN